MLHCYIYLSTRNASSQAPLCRLGFSFLRGSLANFMNNLTRAAETVWKSDVKFWFSRRQGTYYGIRLFYDPRNDPVYRRRGVAVASANSFMQVEEAVVKTTRESRSR